MQLAIGLAMFALGYWAALTLAAKPDKGRRDILNFFDQISAFFSGITIRSPAPSREASPVRSSSVDSISGQKLLYTKDEIEREFDMSDWRRLAYEDFRTTILARGSGLKTFPCVYATMGYRTNDHRYVFTESPNPAEPRNIRRLGPALIEYLQESRSLGPNTSLVIICAPPASGTTELSVEEYNTNFWEMLRGLRIWDPSPWPADIPEDTENKNWTFCFAGEPLFPVSLTPAHRRRWSRHAATPLIALQPKWVLDNLLGTPQKRQDAQNKVRTLLKQYDQVDVSPDLTDYGCDGSSEVRQLCLKDENESVTCPYRNFET